VLLNLQFLHIWFTRLQLTGLRVVCSPVFYCHSCPLATTACPLGVLINFGKLQLIPFITLGILGLVGTLGGRFVCGWACPFGLLQDLLHRIPSPKFKIPHKLTYTKYVVLVLFVIVIPIFWPKAPYSFCDGCPSSFLESTIPWAAMAHWHVTPGMFNGFTARFMVRGSITLAVLLLAVMVSRGFCRLFCPLGAIFSLFNRFSLFRFNLTYSRCNDCKACAKLCPVDIDPVTQMNTAECIRCYECTLTKHIKLGAK